MEDHITSKTKSAQPSDLNDLGTKLWDRYRETGELEDLKQASKAFQAALDRTSLDSPERSMYLANLGAGLVDLYIRSQELPDLVDAIRVCEEALESLSLDSPDRLIVLGNLGKALQLRFGRLGDLRDLDLAIRAHEEVLASTPADSPDCLLIQGNLDAALADLERAIEHYNEVLARAPSDWSGRGAYLTKLGIGSGMLYERTKALSDLNAAIAAYQAAVDAMPLDAPERAVVFTKLGLRLEERYERKGALEDLEAAIAAYQAAVGATPSNAPERIVALTNLGIGLGKLYERTGRLNDLETAITTLQAAVDATPPNAPERVGRLTNLGNGLRHRYARTGALEDLEAVIAAYQAAVDATPLDVPERAGYLSNLGNGLEERYERTGALQDLEAGITTLQAAVGATPSNAPERGRYLNNLGTGLLKRYERTRAVVDLEAAITTLQAAVDATPPNAPARAGRLSNLGAGLNQRYARTGMFSDLEAAITTLQAAVDATPPNAPDRATLLSNLGAGRRQRYARTGMFSDLEAAITTLQAAVDATPPNAPAWARHCYNLGNGLRDRYAHISTADNQQQATAAYQLACQSGLQLSREVTLVAAQAWTQWAISRRAWDEGNEATGYGLAALEQLYRTQLLRQDRQNWQRDGQGLVTMAAYALARSNQIEQAAFVLESGRTRQLNESLARDRANLQAVRELEPALFEQYQSASARLRQLEAVERQQQVHQDDAAVPPFDWTAHRQLVREAEIALDTAIALIRQLPGYAHFLFQPDFAAVATASYPDQPLVYLVTTSAGSLGLLIQRTGTALQSSAVRVEPIWADDFTEAELRTFLVKQEDGQQVGGYLPGQFGRQDWLQAALDEGLHLLGQRLMAPLADRLRMVGARCATLIPAGLLNLLPLHAARYTVNGSDCYFDDEFTVTYAPSAQVVTHSEHTLATHPVATPTLLAVGNPLPMPAGVRPLYFALIEVEAVAQRFNGRATRFTETGATHEEVIRHLSAATYIHFSCHGQFDAEQPLASGLVLSYGQQLTLATILDKLSLQGVRLAVLSACQTAISDFNNVPDEVIGLPAGFLQASVPGVIGSLWPVDDLSTTLLMDCFYRLHLEEKLEPAVALREAQHWLRGATVEELGLATRYEQLYRTSGQSDAQLYRAMRYYQVHPEVKPFTHPFYWAAFTFNGI